MSLMRENNHFKTPFSLLLEVERNRYNKSRLFYFLLLKKHSEKQMCLSLLKESEYRLQNVVAKSAFCAKN